ncbi:MAG: hypothetical protein V1747_09000 [Candidatus Omnitrophota bacterium]
MDKKHLNNKGLSLVEVVMAALLLTLVLAALFATYRNANNLISLSHHKLIALTWAQSLLESEKADFRGTYTDPASPNWLSVEKGGASAIARNNLGATMQHIKVTITWTE